MIKDIKKYTLLEGEKIYNSIKKLENSDLRVFFVVNKNSELVGSVTDGDIRRAIINKIEFSDNVEKICNKKTIFKYKNKKNKYNFNRVLDKTLIPILNQKKKILGFQKKKINKSKNRVLIMAGGKGQRLYPLTKNQPKALVKINGKPMIEHLIFQLLKSDINDIIVSLYHKKEKIINFLNKRKFKKINISFLEEHTPLGTAGAISLIKKDFKDLMVINCDVKILIDFNKIINFHKSENAHITIVSKQFVSKSKFGVIDLKKNFLVKKIDEKPLIANYINVGAYILNSKVRKLIKKNQRLDMNELINLAVKSKFKVITYPLYENWIDLGNISAVYKMQKK
jgi:dTDP-glucose pyrophosphorylase